ncbi:hypothetical protein PFFVO_06115, partial [Plasmodium falciparum Vietnam Oak-Knoll (FVO)]
MVMQGPRGGSSGEDDKDAKHVLDSIGEKVYKEVKKVAANYSSQLKGTLSNAIFENEPKGQQTENDPCKLLYEYHTNVTKGHGREHPCRKGTEKRFSDVGGGECDNRKIKDSKNNGGACAPYRRLHLCVRNLENISALDKINNDTLLADVCLAALHEGQSITQDYPKYQAQYASSFSPSQICTMLARSFADIGDIIRGKDLYIGNKKEKLDLEKNLKKIFGKIYEKLTDPRAKDHYKDEPDNNFFQLREDWWNANRQEVWKAITCHAGESDKYFRKTACGTGTGTQGRCRCNDDKKPGSNTDPPTYFDYVPQYLRWFEEWSEDFCTKRKHKLENAIEKCRGQDGSGKEKYCDFNGFDCKGTASGKHKYLWDNACAGCFFSCSDFRKWIAKQKDEFEKQKNKYTDEIKKNDDTTITTEYGTINNMYRKDFYKHLEEKYKTVDAFLNLLNKEKECKNHPEVGEGKKKYIDFNDNIETFSHTEYCEPCPWCGIEEQKDGKWKRINDHSACKEEELYTPKENAKYTKINVLTSGEGHEDIAKRLKEFCTKTQNGGGGSDDCGGNSDSSLCEPWQCYQPDQLEKVGGGEVDDKLKGAGGLCIFEKMKGEKKVKKQKTFNNFFNFWVAHVLKDSIDWRTQLTKCLSEDKLKKCEKGCKSNCECFKKWIEKKEKEWIKVKDQFNKQTDFLEWKHYLVLETILENYYFENIQKAYGDLKSIQEMKKMIKENKQNKNRTKDDEDALDVLFDHEKEEAEDCLDIHEDDDDDDECVEEIEKIPNNPCSGTRHRAMVKNVAADMYRAARQQLRNRAGGRKTLRADASQGHYNGKANESVLKDVCDITNQYSNAIGDSKDPCNGKGDGFKIGTPWTNIVKKKTTSYKDVFLPPRREHMCTSNLENLDVGDVTNNVNVNNKFLVQVLLSANKQAEWIKQKYNEPNGQNNHKGKCRALKSSFADLGDIIKGTDLWDKDSGEQKTQRNLVTIFGKIKVQRKGIDTSKYTNTDGKHNQLREDWWEANRRQVWKAMKCALKGEKINCGATPYDDYIPQRLRWMTEWAEWFCKEQSRLYDELMGKCGICMNGICNKVKDDCAKCTEACKEYKTKIQPWKDQWEKLELEYALSYLHAKNDSRRMAFGGTDPDYQQVVHFFKELQEAIKSSTSKRPKRSTDAITTDPTTPYSTAAGYIHQEIGNAGCQIQKHFCDDNKDKYVFREKPKDHDEACNCTENVEKPKKEEIDTKLDVCAIVKTALTTQDNLTKACQQKYGHPQRHWGWKCISETTTKSSDSGSICVPPRRRKLYVTPLTKWAEEATEGPTSPQAGGEATLPTPATASSQAPKGDSLLLTAFIQSAAVETFFLWHKYKMDNNGGDAEDKLKKGEIPEEFKRQMFYTLADYRDICIGVKEDVIKALEASSDNKSGNNIKEISDKIEAILKQSGSKLPGGLPVTPNNVKNPKTWWDQNAKHIWHGMVCALTYKEDTGGAKGKTSITQDPTAYGKLWDNDGKKPKEDKYDYKIVKISSVPSSNVPSGDTKLEEFSRRPTFFRWLEEWGEEFCRKRKDKLEKIEKECYGLNYRGHRIYCSGDGHICEKTDTSRNNTFIDLHCPRCLKECIKYKRWIEKKEKEFHNQKNNYEKEFNNDLKEKGYSSFNNFLASLNHCKHGEHNRDDKNKIEFNNHTKTFGPSEYCKACPVYGVKCNKKNGECETIHKTDLNGQNDNNYTDIKVLVIDRKGESNDEELKNVCNNTSLFKDSSVQYWKCQKKNEVDQCIIDNFLDIDIDKYMEFNVFFQRWLRYFVHDYNILKDKIKPCIKTKDEKSNKCINGCKGKLECVKKWLKQKQDEWKNIKDHYEKNKSLYGYGIPHWVKSYFVEQLYFDKDYKKAQDVIEDENERKKIWGCTDGVECTNEETKENKDFITNLIKKLQEKIESCQTQHNPNGKTKPCDEIPPHSDETLDEQTDTTTDDDNSDKIYDTKPPFCPKDVEDTKETEKPKVLPGPPDACEIVGEILNGQDGTKKIEECNTKYYPTKNDYPGWNCTDKVINREEGSCMPPRRQKLCIHNLEHLSEKATETELRKAFIECAAIETFWLWDKYKEDKKDEKKTEGGGISDDPDDPQKKLEGGTIPEDFKRQMFYTYGDYRDFLFGTDISKGHGKESALGKKIDSLFKNGDQKSPSGKTPTEWWNDYGPDIWKGMVCGLSHHIKNGNKEQLRKNLTDNNKYTKISSKLEDFASRPQFLRWFIEWGDQFCRERVVKINQLKTGCNEYECGSQENGKKEACKNACEAYKSWLKDWKDQYEQQTAKFDKDKKDKKFDGTSAEVDVAAVSSVHEYLQEELKNLCTKGDCACMEKPSAQDEETELLGENYFPEAMDYPPKEIGERCKCAIPSEPMSCVEQIAKHLREKAEKNVKIYESSLKGTPAKSKNDCTKIDEAIKGDNGSKIINKSILDSTFASNCEQSEKDATDRLKIGKQWQFNKINGTETKLYVPPRRKDMCFNDLKNIQFNEVQDSNSLLEKIQHVAKNEGIDILKKLNPQDQNAFSEICDAMKYSFADLGDIIRGRSKIDPTNNNKIEKELQKIFKQIQDDNASLSKMELPELREKWWDANRKEVWNAM